MPRKPEPSFRLKEIIWDLAATTGAENLSALLKDLDYKLEGLRKNKIEDFSEDTPDIRTIRRIIEVDIQRLPQEVIVSKLPSHVWRLRHDYNEIEQLAEEKQPQEVPKEAQTERKSYEETPRSPVPPDLYVSRQYQKHQNDMIRLVKRLSAELAPPLSHFHIRNLGKVGLHRVSDGELDTGLDWSLVWQVNGERSVCLCYELEADEDAQTRIMRGYLEEHLHSSTYFWLIEDEKKGIRKWKRLGGEELRAQTRFLTRIDREVEKLTNSALGDPNRMTYAGPSTWFSDSIWAAILDGLYRTLDYKIEPYDNGLFKVQYGATFMGLTATKEEGEQYVEWHKKLMAKYERSRTVKAINLLRQERDSVAKGIQDVLIKFVVDRHLPGKCSYEFCR